MKTSAGILLFNFDKDILKVFLVHPGGPFWIKKDEGAWSIPKGEPDPNEELLSAAIRETEEETGITVQGDLISLGSVTQRGGKVVTAWASWDTFDPATIRSNTFDMEWPPGSGKLRKFPEIDKAEWFTIEEAKRKIIPSQYSFVERLSKYLEENDWTSMI